MYEQIEKPKENKSRAVTNNVGQKKSKVKQGFGFVGNRPESLVQRKLQAMADNCISQQQPIQKAEEPRGNRNDVIQRVIVFGSKARADQFMNLAKGVEKYYPGSTNIMKAWRLLKPGDLAPEKQGFFSSLFSSKPANETLVLGGHGSPGKWADMDAATIVTELRHCGFSNKRFSTLVIAGCHGATRTSTDETLIGNLKGELDKNPETLGISVSGVPGILMDHGADGDLSAEGGKLAFTSGVVTVNDDSSYIPPRFL